MFNLKEEWGDHKIFSYPTIKNHFLEYFQNLFNEKELDKLHLKSLDYNIAKSSLSGSDSI